MDLYDKVDDEKLIKAVRVHLCLYDKALPAYRNMLAKKKAWNSVANAVGKDVELCQQRWRNLRDRYVREATKKVTSENGNERTSEWGNFEAMSFLKEYITPRRKGIKISALDCDNNQSIDDYSSLCEKLLDDFPSTPSPLPLPSQPKRQKLIEAAERFDKLMGIVETMVAKTKTETRRSHADFFSVLEGLLNKLPEPTQDDLKFKMYDLTYQEVVKIKNP